MDSVDLHDALMLWWVFMRLSQQLAVLKGSRCQTYRARALWASIPSSCLSWRNSICYRSPISTWTGWDTWSHPRYWNVFMFILMIALVVLYVLRSERDPQLFISADNLYLWRSTFLQSTCSLTHWCSSSGAFDWTRTCGMLREPQLMWIFTSQFWLRIIVASSIFNIGFKDVKGMHVIISWLAPSKELCGADCRSLLCNRGEVRDCDIVRTVREMNLTSRFAGFLFVT